MVGYAEAQTGVAADRTGDRRAGRRRDRLRHVRRRDPDQPGQVLQVHRRLPDRRGRRDPVLRHRRAADGRLAAGPERARHSTSRTWFNWSSWYGEVIQGIFNVTPTPTVLQFSRVAGLPRHRAGDLPAPDEGARETPIHSPPTAYPNPKGQPREASFVPRRRHRCAGGSGTDRAARPRSPRRPTRTGQRARPPRSPSPPPTPRASCRAPKAQPAPTPSSSPTTAPRSPSSTSTARASG